MVRSPWNRGWAALALARDPHVRPADQPAVGRIDFDEPIRVAQAEPPANAAANALIAKDAHDLTRKANITPADLEKIIELVEKGIDEARFSEAWPLRRNPDGLGRSTAGARTGSTPGKTKPLADFEKAISLDPSKHLAYHNRGYIRASQGNFEGALSDFDRTVEIKPDFVKGWINRGELYYAVGSWDKAVADYTEALRLQPRQPDVQNQAAGMRTIRPDAARRARTTPARSSSTRGS